MRPLSFTIAKILEALGLGVVVVGFLLKFPQLMDFKLFLSGIIVFILGWLLERYR